MADLTNLEFTEDLGGAAPQQEAGFGASTFGTSTFGVGGAFPKTRHVTVHGPVTEEVVAWASTLPDGNYSWRARVTDAMGKTSGWSEVYYFTVETSYVYVASLVSDLNPLGALGPEAKKSLDGALGQSENYDGPGGYDSAALYDSGLEGAALDATLTIKRALYRSYEGSFDSTGAVTGRARRLVSAALSLSSAMLRTSRSNVASVLTFSATGAGRLVVVVAAALGVSGTAYLATKRSLTSGLTQQASLVPRARLSMSGALTASSTHIERIRRLVSGALAFVGAFARDASLKRVLVAALGLSGATQRQLRRLVAGALSSDATLTRIARHPFTGSLSSAAIIVRRARPVKGASVGFSSAGYEAICHLISGSLALNGVISRVASLKRYFTATLSLGSALTRRPGRHSAGSIGFARTHTDKLRRSLASSVSASSEILRQNRVALAGFINGPGSWDDEFAYDSDDAYDYAGYMGSSLGVRKWVLYVHALASALSLAGKVHPGRAFEAIVSFAGAITRAARPSLSTVLNLDSILRLRRGFSVAGALNMSADVTDLTRKMLVAILDTGAAKKADVRVWLYAAVEPIGSITKHVAALRAGALTTSGAMVKLQWQILGSALEMAATLKPRLGLALVAAMDIFSSISRRVSAIRHARLDPQGLVIHKTLFSLVGAMSARSEIVGKWRTRMTTSGSASFTATVRRGATARVVGALTLNSAVGRSMTRALTATMSWMSSLAAPRYSRRYLWADIWPKTAVKFSTMRGLFGVLSPTAKSVREIQHSLVAALSQTGSVTPIKSARVIIGSALSWSGMIRRNLAIRITARLLLQGAVYKGNLRYLAGSIGPSGYVRKGLYWALGSALELVASLTHRMTYPSFARPRRRLDVKNRFGGTQRYHPVDK